MKRIFCPVDFVETSWPSVIAAYDLAIQSEGVLILMHAYHLDVQVQHNDLNSNWDKKIRDEFDEKLDLMISRLIEYKPNLAVNFEKKLCQGFAVDQIIEVSNTCHCDLIVLNSKSSKGFSDKVAGSISTNVIENTAIPVLILPNGFQGLRFENIVVSILPDMVAKTDFAFITDLVRLNNSKLIFLSVTDEVDETDSDLRKKIQSETDKPGFEFESKVIDGTNLEEAVETFVKDNQADILVMIRGKKNFWQKIFHKGNTRKMTAKIEFPLLVLQEKS